MKIRLSEFKISNFRCIDDSSWISLDDITALVGVNEAGKTAILNGLHTLNPGSGNLELDPINDFPRDRYTKDFDENCTLAEGRFIIPKDYLKKNNLIEKFNLSSNKDLTLKLERRYNKRLYYRFDPPLITKKYIPTVLESLSEARRLINRKIADENTAFTEDIRKSVLTIIDAFRKEIEDTYGRDKIFTITQDREEFGDYLDSKIRDLARYIKQCEEELNPLLDDLEEISREMRKKSLSHQLYDEIKDDIPVFIYFEDYYILNGTVVIPHLIKALEGDIRYREFRIQNTLFKHVGLNPKEIYNLGAQGDSEQLSKEKQADLKKRKILLDSASKKITETLNKYFQERDYEVEYNVDGQFLEILISDNERPSKINLEERSKGFRWYFSFFLTFLVESEGAHKNAVLLLDEPGIHLHLQAQYNLIEFFEKLKETNQIVYTTHSPFLIDEEHLEQVRSVYETEEGKTKVTDDNVVPDQKSVFPIQASLSYKASQLVYKELIQVLVENKSDYNYLKMINLILKKLGRETLNEEVIIIPCNGVKSMEYYSRMFIDLGRFPVVLLHSDQKGQKVYDKLVRTLFSEKRNKVIMIGDLFNHKQNYELEDLIEKETLINFMNQMELTSPLIPVSKIDSNEKRVVSSLREYCRENRIELPNNWRESLSKNLMNHIIENGEEYVKDQFNPQIIEKFNKLIEEINKRTN